jgi:hypothetical protein
MARVKPIKSSELDSDSASDHTDDDEGNQEEEDNDEEEDHVDKEDEDDEDSPKEDEEEDVQEGRDQDFDEESEDKEGVGSNVPSSLPDKEVDDKEPKKEDKSVEPESKSLFDQISKVEEADIGQFLTNNHKFVKLKKCFEQIRTKNGSFNFQYLPDELSTLVKTKLLTGAFKNL